MIGLEEPDTCMTLAHCREGDMPQVAESTVEMTKPRQKPGHLSQSNTNEAG